MSSAERPKFLEDFYDAIATNEHIAEKAGDLLRILMRATAATKPSASTSKAVSSLLYIIDLAQRCEDFDLNKVIGGAIARVADVEVYDQLHSASMDAAKAGVMLFVESSAIDQAASSRARKRNSNFISAIRHLEALRGNQSWGVV